MVELALVLPLMLAAAPGDRPVRDGLPRLHRPHGRDPRRRTSGFRRSLDPAASRTECRTSSRRSTKAASEPRQEQDDDHRRAPIKADGVTPRLGAERRRHGSCDLPVQDQPLRAWCSTPGTLRAARPSASSNEPRAALDHVPLGPRGRVGEALDGERRRRRRTARVRARGRGRSRPPPGPAGSRARRSRSRRGSG